MKAIKPVFGSGILIPHSRSLLQDNPVSGEHLYPKNLYFPNTASHAKILANPASRSSSSQVPYQVET